MHNSVLIHIHSTISFHGPQETNFAITFGASFISFINFLKHFHDETLTSAAQRIEESSKSLQGTSLLHYITLHSFLILNLLYRKYSFIAPDVILFRRPSTLEEKIIG